MKLPAPLIDWDAETVAVWLRGVEKIPRETLENLIAKGVDGRRLLAMTAEDLEAEGIASLGMRLGIATAVDRLDELEQYLATSPVSTLGARLLRAGRCIDTEPLEAVAQMTAALTTALQALDQQPPADSKAYGAVRCDLLQIASSFLAQAGAHQVCARARANNKREERG